MKDIWDYIYGSKSSMNLAGKIIIGVPIFPVILAFVVFHFLFSKKVNHD